MSMSLGFTSPSSGALGPEMTHNLFMLQVSYLETMGNNTHLSGRLGRFD